jgi:hypothetical protein
VEKTRAKHAWRTFRSPLFHRPGRWYRKEVALFVCLGLLGESRMKEQSQRRAGNLSKKAIHQQDRRD